MTSRDVDAPLSQSLQQQRLRDTLMVVLVQDQIVQRRSEVTARNDLVGQGRYQGLPLDGEPAFAAVTGGVCFKNGTLDDVFFVTLEAGAGGRLRQGQQDLAMDGELCGFRAPVGTGSLAGLRRWGCRFECFQGTGLDLGSWLETFEGGDLVFEQGRAILLLMDKVSPMRRRLRGMGVLSHEEELRWRGVPDRRRKRRGCWVGAKREFRGRRSRKGISGTSNRVRATTRRPCPLLGNGRAICPCRVRAPAPFLPWRPQAVRRIAHDKSRVLCPGAGGFSAARRERPI